MEFFTGLIFAFAYSVEFIGFYYLFETIFGMLGGIIGGVFALIVTAAIHTSV